MQSLFFTDEELGKKDDDHKPVARGSLHPQSWHPVARAPPRKTFKRLAIALLVAAAVYLFVEHIPTDVPIRDRRHPVYPPPASALLARPGPVALGKAHDPSVHDAPAAEDLPTQDYDGPVRFVHLGLSLYAIAGTKGSQAVNRNVLFAASSLKSVATLLPMACQMGAELRSYVHFALMSRSDIDLQQLQELNGIDESCQVIFHGMALVLSGCSRFLT